MQEVINPTEPRQTRGLSLMSMDSQATLPKEESILSDPATEKAARQMRLKKLFCDEGDTVINIPGQYQDEENPANLDEITKVTISQDADKDEKLTKALETRKGTLAARLSLDETTGQSTLTAHPSVEPTIEITVEPDIKALAGRLSAISNIELESKTQADLDAKIEQAREKTNKINQLIEDIKQSMTKAKGYLVTGLERGAYLIAAANVVMIIWSTIDAARNVETLPYAVYITDAALIVLTATAQILHSLHNKLKQEEETEFIPEDHPGNIPQSAITFKQQLRNKLSHCWSTVTNCLSKIAGTHLITGAALVSAGVTFTAARWPQVISPLAAEWIDNGENILDGLIIAWVIFSKKAINKLYAIRAKKEAQRRASDDGVVHKKTELQTLPDRRDSLKPEVQVEVKKKHGTKGSIEMVSSLPEESPITMVANPLVSAALETDRDGHESDESPTDTDKNSTPEKRDSSEKTSQASSVQVSPAMPPKQLDFTAEAETEPIPTV